MGGGVSRNQQAPTVRVSAAQGFQQSDAVHARHTEVTDDQIGAELMGNSQCRFRIFGGNYRTEVAQLPKEQSAHFVFVIHNENERPRYHPSAMFHAVRTMREACRRWVLTLYKLGGRYRPFRAPLCARHPC